MRSKVVGIGVLVMAIGVGMMIAVIVVLDEGGSGSSLLDVEINQEETLWAFRALLVAIGLLVSGFFAIGLGLILRPVGGQSLDGYYVEEKKAFDVSEARDTQSIDKDVPYSRQHVKVGTVVVFCRFCGYANLPEDERCNDCGRHLVHGDRPW